MFLPLENPNLPSGKVGHVAVSDYSPRLIEYLEKNNITTIVTTPSKNLDDRICYHTDMLMLNIGKGKIIADESQSSLIVKYLTIGYRVEYLNKKVNSPYPNDSLLNVAVIGDKLICNPKTTIPYILNLADEYGYKLISANQGYVKCSVCIVNQNALITDDESVYKASQLNEIDSILISKGSVELKGFDYGFIGGCTGLIDENKMLFNGDINYHKDCTKIIDFLNKHNVKPVIIESQPLTDIGGIIPLTEKIAVKTKKSY